MPVSHQFHDRVLVISCNGRYSQAELRSAWAQAEAASEYSEADEFCLDVRASSSLARRSVRELRDIAEWFVGRAGRFNRRCAIVTRPGMQFGLMRMASMWVEYKGIEAVVFVKMEQAVAWLESRAAQIVR